MSGVRKKFPKIFNFGGFGGPPRCFDPCTRVHGPQKVPMRKSPFFIRKNRKISKNAQKPPKMVSGINLGQKKRVFGYFCPWGRKLAIFEKMGILAILGSNFGIFSFFWSIFDYVFPLTIKSHKNPPC